MDYITKIYFKYNEYKYRVKVFDKTITIERQQPHEGNLQIRRPSRLFNDGVWDIDELINQIHWYEYEITKMNAEAHHETL